MIKIILFAILLNFSFVYADENDNLVLELQKDETLATSINNFIEDRGALPTTITELKNAGYLPGTFDERNTIDNDNISFSFLDGNKKIRVSTSIETTDLINPLADAYINNDAYRKYIRLSSIQGIELVSDYMISILGLNNLKIKSLKPCFTYVGKAEPTTYTTVNAGDLWLEANFRRYNVYKYNGTTWDKIGDQNTKLNIDCSISNNDFVELSKTYWSLIEVDITKEEKNILCTDAGTNYNPLEDRCEAYTSQSCDGFVGYDNTEDKCYNWKYANKINSTTTYNATETTVAGKIQHNCGGYSGLCQSRYCNEISGNTVRDTRTADAYASCTISNMSSITWSNPATHSQVMSSHDDNRAIWVTDTYVKIAPRNDILNSYYIGTVPSTTSYSCPNGGTLSGTTCTKTIKVCPSGYSEYGSSTQCRAKDYSNPSCIGKQMTVNPFYLTPHYGNNGLCYSDVGLYCKTTGVSWDGLYTCFNNNITCPAPSTSYNLNLTTDYCEKYLFTCPIVNSNRYGLSEHPTINDSATLFNSILNKDDKATAVASSIIAGDVNVNDNNGAMCVEQKVSIFPQGVNSFIIGGKIKSAF